MAEWDYGDYEGLTTPEIRKTVPDWTVWTYGCPDGESVDAVTVRADRAVAWPCHTWNRATWSSSATATSRGR